MWLYDGWSIFWIWKLILMWVDHLSCGQDQFPNQNWALRCSFVEGQNDEELSDLPSSVSLLRWGWGLGISIILRYFKSYFGSVLLQTKRFCRLVETCWGMHNGNSHSCNVCCCFTGLLRSLNSRWRGMHRWSSAANTKPRSWSVYCPRPMGKSHGALNWQLFMRIRFQPWNSVVFRLGLKGRMFCALFWTRKPQNLKSLDFVARHLHAWASFLEHMCNWRCLFYSHKHSGHKLSAKLRGGCKIACCSEKNAACF